jgi:hypothetical protein
MILPTTSSVEQVPILFRFLIPISSGEVGIESVGKFLRERRSKVFRLSEAVGRVHFQNYETVGIR